METADTRNESTEEVGAVSMSPSTSLLALPLTWEWDEYGGYDCMSGGWHIKNAQGKTLFTIDDADFAYYEDGAGAVLARWICEKANATLQGSPEAQRKEIP